MHKMTRNEYMENMTKREGWKPGWEAIAVRFSELYGDDTLQYVEACSVLDVESPLEGFGVAVSPKGYVHIVTCGLTNIKADIDAFGNLSSGWGYELTIKMPGHSTEACHNAFILLNRLARMIQTKRLRFRNLRSISLKSLNQESDLNFITFSGLMFIYDTELSSINTLHGQVDFLQVVNITDKELAVLKRSRYRISQLAFNLKEHYPDLQMDVERKKDYLE